MSRCSQAIMPSASSTVLGFESAAVFPGTLGLLACACFGAGAGAASGLAGIVGVYAAATEILPSRRRDPRSSSVHTLCGLDVVFRCVAEDDFRPAGLAASC